MKPLQESRLVLSRGQSTTISQRRLINAINHTHFKNETLWAHIRGQSKAEEVLVRVSPGPCLNDSVVCEFGKGMPLNLADCHVEHLIIEDDKAAIVIPVTVQAFTPHSITVTLPEKGFRLDTRKVRRLSTEEISCRLRQADRCLEAQLQDFSVTGLRLLLEEATDIAALDPAQPVELGMYKAGACVFEGSCRIIRRESTRPGSLVLSPEHRAPGSLRTFGTKRLRNPRIHLLPTPKVLFTHPLSNTPLAFEIFDITTFGFSVYEHQDEAVLMPGMLIPEVTLLFGGSIKLQCTAQVLYAQRKGDRRRVGFSLRDMDGNMYIRLYDIIANALDPHANSSQVTDMNALWDIFFETGFIYPQKYEYLSRHRDAFKETYRRLYQDGKDIFYHFTYRQNGRIYGHISFIRAYQRLWMIHHFAARPMHGQKRIGLEVYKHIFNLYDTARRLPSAKLDYIMFYFRPTSSFNMYFQAGFCRMVNNPRVCSMDQFSYQYLPLAGEDALPEGWRLEKLEKDDLQTLRSFYDEQAGGLFLDALGIGKTYPQDDPLEEVYAHLGLLRRTALYALRQAGKLKAVYIVDQSDIGINLSELLNGIKIIVTDPADLPWAVLTAGIRRLAGVYPDDQIPVMIYPHTYPESQGIACSRSYYLWILDSRYGDIYVQHMKKKIRIPPFKLLFRALFARLRRGKKT